MRRPAAPPTQQARFIAWLGATLAVALVVQSPLIFNPGYFSADELQWWLRAAVPYREMPWVAWSDFAAFQYRPVTFNAWLVLAHACAEHAYLMHGVFVVLGTVNAALIAVNLRSLGVGRAPAAAAAIVFVCTPYVAYTHGWTGTLADILVLLCGLIGFAVLRTLRSEQTSMRVLAVAVIVAMLQSLALASKESAVVLPLLLLCAAAAHAAPKRVLLIASLAATIVAMYLGLRLRTLLDTPVQGYGWHLAEIPRRVAEYTVFPWLPPLLEVGPSLEKGAWRLVVATFFAIALVYSLARCSWRLAAALPILFIGMLAPTLVLDQSANQYAYLASAVAVGVPAFAWRSCPPHAKMLIFLAGAIACLHGAQVMLRMREIGAIEQRFHSELVDDLASGGAIAIVPARASDAWLLQRFTENVPGYRGTSFIGRVHPGAAPAGSAQMVMQPNGSLQPADAGSQAR